MNIRFAEITKENWEECCYLRITREQDQQGFCAPNWYSIIESVYSDKLYPYCIYDDSKMIGFFMYGFDTDLNDWGLIRLMIDQRYQHSGYGKVILPEILKMVKSRLGKIDFYTSVEPANCAAAKLYESFGFYKTGGIISGEDGEDPEEVMKISLDF